MKIEIRIAPRHSGREALDAVFHGNKGRMRWVGVRLLNVWFDRFQRMHERLAAQADGLSAQTYLDCERLNKEVVAEAKALGTKTAVVFIDLGDNWTFEKLDCLLAGLVGEQTTIHWGIDQDASQLSPGKSLEEAGNLVQLRYLHSRYGTAACTVREVTSRPDAQLNLVHVFLRDIGVSPETMKFSALALSSEMPEGGRPTLSTFGSAGAISEAPLTVFFMVEPGPLEPQAHLLIASLLVNCRDNFRMIAFCREELVEGLHENTISFLAANGVALRPIENSFEDGYPAGNKLIAASSVRAEGWAIFLDTDMALVRESRFMDVTSGRRVSLCLDTVIGWAKADSDFQDVANELGFDGFPRKQPLWGGRESHPTYNAGLVFFPAAEGEDEDFGQKWLAVAKQLDAAEQIQNKRPWLDTIALAGLAAKESNIRPLELEWNCTTRMADESTRVLHYHGLRQIRQYGWQSTIDEILARSPSPFDTYASFISAYKQDKTIEGDIERRAMRHAIIS